MTRNEIQLLQDILPIMQRIRQLEMQAEWEHDRMTNITAHLSPDKGSGHGNALNMDDIFARIDALQGRHRALMGVYEKKMRRAEAVINGIGNERDRAFAVMVYVEGFAAADVKKELNLSDWDYRQTKQRLEGKNE